MNEPSSTQLGRPPRRIKTILAVWVGVLALAALVAYATHWLYGLGVIVLAAAASLLRFEEGVWSTSGAIIGAVAANQMTAATQTGGVSMRTVIATAIGAIVGALVGMSADRRARARRAAGRPTGHANE